MGNSDNIIDVAGSESSKLEPGENVYLCLFVVVDELNFADLGNLCDHILDGIEKFIFFFLKSIEFWILNGFRLFLLFFFLFLDIYRSSPQVPVKLSHRLFL